MRVNAEDGFTYHQILTMYVVNDTKVFLLEELEAVFQQHFMAYEVTKSGKTKLCLYDSFARHGVLHLKNKQNSMYIIEKDSADISV